MLSEIPAHGGRGILPPPRADVFPATRSVLTLTPRRVGSLLMSNRDPVKQGVARGWALPSIALIALQLKPLEAGAKFRPGLAAYPTHPRHGVVIP